MQISQRAWNNYIKKLSAVCSEAGNKMKAFVAKYGLSNQDALLRYAMRLVQQYGEGSAALACEMYDEIAALSGADVPPAEPAEVASQHEVAEGVMGSLKQSPSGQLIDSVVNRLVKQAGADTTLKNAKRDRCEFAWVPSGDTCAFCFMLASAGWRKAGPKTIHGDHAEHIHAHCDCQYCIRFDSNTNVAGYDPDAMRDKWDSLDGSTSSEKMNALRRETYASRKESGYKDITDELRKNAKPGIGKIIFESEAKTDDREMAEWIHSNYGGDITVLNTKSEIGKMPDAMWDGNYWEFKRPTSKNAIQKRIRKANQQIIEATQRDGRSPDGCGVIIDVSGCDMSDDEVIRCVQDEASDRFNFRARAIIRRGDRTLKAIEVKK